MGWVRKHVIHNLPLKIMAVLIAGWLWAVVARQPIAEVGVTVHIEFHNVPPNLEIATENLPEAHVRLRGVYTNTVPVDAYRGAGRPEAAYLIERAVDNTARELGVTPESLRKKNFIKPKAMPYTTPTGKIYDSGDFAATMARAQELAGWDGFNKRAAGSKRAGRCKRPRRSLEV